MDLTRRAARQANTFFFDLIDSLYQVWFTIKLNLNSQSQLNPFNSHGGDNTIDSEVAKPTDDNTSFDG